jgi:hypothetical protein
VETPGASPEATQGERHGPQGQLDPPHIAFLAAVTAVAATSAMPAGAASKLAVSPGKTQVVSVGVVQGSACRI